MPFRGKDLARLYVKVKKGEFDPITHTNYSQEITSSISKLICRNAHERMTLDEIFELKSVR